MRALVRRGLAGVCLTGIVSAAQAQDHRDHSAWKGAKGWWAVMEVEVGAVTTTILVNGTPVLEVPASSIGSLRGAVGVRVGPGLDLHVTKVTVTAAGS